MEVGKKGKEEENMGFVWKEDSEEYIEEMEENGRKMKIRG